MLASFSGSVTDSGGRTVAVQPERQIVEPIVAWVTAGLTAPGVHRGSGRPDSPLPTIRHEPRRGWAWTSWPLALEYARPEGATRPASAVGTAGAEVAIASATIAAEARTVVVLYTRLPSENRCWRD
jgi:hypothetical protein